VLTTDGLSLHTATWPPPTTAKGLIGLVHGLGEHSGRYRELVTFLNQAGYLLAAFDLRGHGRSPGPRGHAPSYRIVMADIARFLDEVTRPHLPTFLYGHSLGGNLVLNYVLRYRPALTGVIVTAPALRPAFRPPVWKVGLGKLMYHWWPALALPAGLELAGISRDPQVIQAYRQDSLVHDQITVRFGLEILQAGVWALEHSAEFALPLLLMHGGADRLTSVQASCEFAHKVGNHGTLKIWENCYHELHHEPEKLEIFNYLLNWLVTH